MITLQRGKTAFIPFLGSHDQCQRWLENNSRLKTFHAGKGKTIHIEDKNTAPTNAIEVQKMDGDADVDGFVQSLTDKDLRTVFKGERHPINAKGDQMSRNYGKSNPFKRHLFSIRFICRDSRG